MGDRSCSRSRLVHGVLATPVFQVLVERRINCRCGMVEVSHLCGKDLCLNALGSVLKYHRVGEQRACSHGLATDSGASGVTVVTAMTCLAARRDGELQSP